MQFEEIYTRYYKEVYYYLLSLNGSSDLAEELTQETFYRAMKSISRFRGECALGTWLCQIAKHTYFTWKKKHERELVSENPTEITGGETEGRGRDIPHMPQTEETVLRHQESLEVYRVLHKLEEPYKEVFTLRTLGELSYREIGEIFGRKEGWARVTYYRAKVQIQQLMQKGEQ